MLRNYLQAVSAAAPLPDQAAIAEASPGLAASPPAVGQASCVPLGQAGGGPAAGQAGPSATAANGEKAEQTKGDSHTGKSGGGGAAAAEAGKGKVEKSKSKKAAKAQLVNPSPNCSLVDSMFVSPCQHVLP